MTKKNHKQTKTEDLPSWTSKNHTTDLSYYEVEAGKAKNCWWVDFPHRDKHSSFPPAKRDHVRCCTLYSAHKD